MLFFRYRVYLLTSIVVLCILAFTFHTPNIVRSQNPLAAEACPAMVTKAISVVGASCKEMGRNEACYGNTLVNANFKNSAAAKKFAATGDTADLLNLQVLTTEPANPTNNTWGIALMKMVADLPTEANAAMTMVLFGDAQVTNTVPDISGLATCVVKNTKTANVNLYRGPGTDRKQVGLLPGSGDATANGRDQSGKWLRVLRNNALGWVDASSVDVGSCSVDKLTVADENDLSTAYTQPMQAFTLKSSTSSKCDDAPDGLMVHAPKGQRANVLVNGVQLSFGSAGFLTALPNDRMSITGLEGQIDVASFGKTVTVLPGFFSTVPLTGLQASGQPTDPQPALSLRNFPRLLRDTVYGGSTGATALGVTATGPSTAATGTPVVVNVGFTGNANTCPTSERKAPLDVVLVIDVSGSMEGGPLEAAKGAAAAYVGQLTPGEDQVGLVTFNSGASVAVGLTPNFGAVTGAIGGLTAGGGTNIGAGLAAGYGAVSGGRANTRKAVVLFSDGGSDPGAAQQAANQIKSGGMNLTTLGFGQADLALLSSLASSGDFLFAPNEATLSDQFTIAAVRQASRVAGRDITLRFRVNTQSFGIEKNVIPNSKISDDGMIEWKLPAIPDGKTINFPVMLRPLATGADVVGSFEVSYLQCLNGDAAAVGPLETVKIEVAAVAPKTEVQASAEGTFIGVDQNGTGTLNANNRERWFVDIPKEQKILGVIVEGAGSAKPPILGNNNAFSLPPLFTIPNYGGQKGRSLTAFPVGSSGPYWLFVTSSGPFDAGTYKLNVQNKVPPDALKPAPLTLDKTLEAKDPEKTTIYQFDGKPEQTITAEIASTKGDVRVKLLDSDYNLLPVLDGAYSYGRGDEVILQQVYQLSGKPPYLYIVDQAQQSLSQKITFKSGDLIRIQKGPLSVGTAGKSVLGDNKRDLWTFEGKKGDIVQFKVATQTFDPYVRVIAPGSKRLWSSHGATIGPLTLPESGTYGVAVDYWQTFIVRNKVRGEYSLTMETLTAGKVEPLTYGKIGSAQLEVGKTDSWAFKAAAGDIIVVELNSLDFQPSIELRDGDGKLLINKLYSTLNTQRLEGFIIPTAGTYSIGVKSAVPTTAGIYTLSLRQTQAPVDLAKAGATAPVASKLNPNEHALYSFDGDQGDTLALTLQSDDFDPAFDLYDQDNTLIAQQESNYSSDGRVMIQNYSLPRKGKYILVARAMPDSGTGSYRLTYKLEKASRGPLALGKPVQEFISSERFVAYTLQADADKMISLVLNAGNQIVALNISDDDGKAIAPQSSLRSGDFTTSVYKLSGKGPFRLAFKMKGNYQLAAYDGDVSKVDNGKIASDGKAVNSDVRDFPKLVQYALDAADKDTVSIKLEPRGGVPAAVEVKDSQGKIIPPLVAKTTQQSTVGTYQLDGTAPYTVSFALQGSYGLTVTKGDILRANKGALTVGKKTADSVAAPALFALYTIEGKPDQFITLQYDPVGTEPKGVLKNKQGDVLKPQGKFTSFQGTIEVYKLSGEGPYTLSIDVQGAYALTLSEGDATVIKKAEIAAPAVAGGQLKFAQRAAYPLKAKAGDKLSLYITYDRSFPIVLGLVDGKGVFREISDGTGKPNREATLTITLSGDEPYTLIVPGEGTYQMMIIDMAVQGVPIQAEGGAGIKVGPGSTFTSIGSVSSTEQLMALARTADSKWIYVRSTRADQLAGWAQAEQLEKVDVSSLPVVTVVQ